MALAFAPHTVTVQAAVEGTVQGDLSVPVPTDGTADTVQCFIVPEKPSTTQIATFAMALRNPHRLFGEPEDVDKFPINALVTWTDDEGGGRKFVCKNPGKAELYLHGLPGDHFSVLMEELEIR